MLGLHSMFHAKGRTARVTSGVDVRRTCPETIKSENFNQSCSPHCFEPRERRIGAKRIDSPRRQIVPSQARQTGASTWERDERRGSPVPYPENTVSSYVVQTCNCPSLSGFQDIASFLFFLFPFLSHCVARLRSVKHNPDGITSSALGVGLYLHCPRRSGHAASSAGSKPPHRIAMLNQIHPHISSTMPMQAFSGSA